MDPILAALADELAELTPSAPTVPFYSTTRDDPRTSPACDASYWVDNLRQTVRFSAAVGAALEDGYRVFAELSPHPLLTRAVEQTADGIETPVAALASLRRDQAQAHFALDFVADLHGAGAAVDFAALHPRGRLVDAPLPTWTHRPCCSLGPAAGRVTWWPPIPCWGPTSGCWRNPSGTPGRPTSESPCSHGWASIE